MAKATVKVKPLLRGYFHQEAFYIAIGACALLIAKSTGPKMLAASVIYTIGLLMMLGISALYHRPTWNPKSRALMKRFDHSAIFVQIAGTMSPLCLLALPEREGQHLMLVAWISTIAGILQAFFWSSAPKFVTASFYVVMGWLALPYLTELKSSLGGAKLSMIVIGGVIYTLGAIGYATKRPRLAPAIFGYHEFFHACTIVAATLHFIVIYQLIN